MRYVRGTCSVCGTSTHSGPVVPFPLSFEDRVSLLCALWLAADHVKHEQMRAKMGASAPDWLRPGEVPSGASVYGPREDARDVLGRGAEIDYLGGVPIKTTIPEDLNELALAAYDRDNCAGLGERVVAEMLRIYPLSRNGFRLNSLGRPRPIAASHVVVPVGQTPLILREDYAPKASDTIFSSVCPGTGKPFSYVEGP